MTDDNIDFAAVAKIPESQLEEQAARAQADRKKNMLRAAIGETAGDQASILGTTTDAVHLLLVAHCQLLEAIATATTVSQIKTAIAGSPLASEASALMADIQSGVTTMPYTIKGVKVVMGDVKRRAKVTHDAIKDVSKP